jgi:hypothetical protein
MEAHKPVLLWLGLSVFAVTTPYLVPWVFGGAASLSNAAATAPPVAAWVIEHMEFFMWPLAGLGMLQALLAIIMRQRARVELRSRGLALTPEA